VSDATAFSSREAEFVHFIAGIDSDPSKMPAHRDRVRSYRSAVQPHSAVDAYLYFLRDEGQDRIRTTYRDNYPRLIVLKTQFDPGNLFRINQSIT
jgi:hypothetical protein